MGGAAIENQRESDGTLVGLPFASYPSAIYFNRDLFDEAGLPYPPQEYGPDGVTVYGEGTEYEGTWDYDKVTELAQILTVDGNGVDATDPAFDRSSTVQWGFHWQWTARVFQNGSYWGANSSPPTSSIHNGATTPGHGTSWTSPCCCATRR